MMEQQQRRPSAFVSHRSVQDVTANFIAASGQLKAGELVKDEYFTLFEAVGALEVCQSLDIASRVARHSHANPALADHGSEDGQWFR